MGVGKRVFRILTGILRMTTLIRTNAFEWLLSMILARLSLEILPHLMVYLKVLPRILWII